MKNTDDQDRIIFHGVEDFVRKVREGVLAILAACSIGMPPDLRMLLDILKRQFDHIGELMGCAGVMFSKVLYRSREFYFRSLRTA